MRHTCVLCARAGIPEHTFGTSISAPVLAGLVAHLNAAIRATPGLEGQRIGYMNPSFTVS